MINHTIKEKLHSKCVDNKIMYEFLMTLLRKEDEGGNHTKVYKQAIEKAVKEAKLDEI